MILLPLSMVLNHNASRYNNNGEAPITILFLSIVFIVLFHVTISTAEAPITLLLHSMVLHHNVSRYNDLCRRFYHDIVTLNGLTSQCITIQYFMEKPLS